MVSLVPKHTKRSTYEQVLARDNACLPADFSEQPVLAIFFFMGTICTFTLLQEFIDLTRNVASINKIVKLYNTVIPLVCRFMYKRLFNCSIEYNH